ncbi:MAG: LysM peptidoglycan-binding domain-containing protein [Rikenellaceae bacterium]
MKRAILILLFLVGAFVSEVMAASERSQTIVFVNGQRYYVHRVESGETLYSLSKLYGVDKTVIVGNNSSIEESGLKSGENIKIPVEQSPVAAMSKSEERKARKTFDTHKVTQGETLYAISRRYQISVAVIVDDNPGINPSQLSLGQEILIRKKETGKSSEDEIIEELKDYKENMNKVAPEGYEYHLVKPKETLYSLLHVTQMSRKEFIEINGEESSVLKAGSIVMVRSQVDASSTEEDANESEEQDMTPRELQFAALRGRDTLHISLLLPLSTSSGSVMSIFEEFYQGFLLGVEDLKKSGRNVVVSLFNTHRSAGSVTQIVESEEFQRSDLIVGPVYEELLDDVLAFAQKNVVPVVSPLATLQNTNSGALFQMAPITEHKYDKIGGLVADSVQVTLIYTDQTDTEYEVEVKELLGGRHYDVRKYAYEHPSIVAQRVAAANKWGGKAYSSSDLSHLIEGDTPSTIFIMPNNETDVDRILSALASAEIGLRSRSLSVNDFTVVYNSKWNRYPNIDRAMLFKDRVTAFLSYHAKRDSEVIKRFDSRYAKAFDQIPSLYSYRGYDVAKIFGEGMYSDIKYGMEGRTFTPLQTTYRFQKLRNSETRANQNWMRVNYQNNFTITIE